MSVFEKQEMKEKKLTLSPVTVIRYPQTKLYFFDGEFCNLSKSFPLSGDHISYARVHDECRGKPEGAISGIKLHSKFMHTTSFHIRWGIDNNKKNFFIDTRAF